MSSKNDLYISSAAHSATSLAVCVGDTLIWYIFCLHSSWGIFATVLYAVSSHGSKINDTTGSVMFWVFSTRLIFSMLLSRDFNHRKYQWVYEKKSDMLKHILILFLKNFLEKMLETIVSMY